MSPKDLFKQEYDIIHKGEALLEEGLFSDEVSAKHYRTLLDHYRKLFSQLCHLVKISDIQQNDLNKLNKELVLLSQFDSLTGIPNRRRFEEELKREWRRHQRMGIPLSLIMIDIDHFKLYNDTYGHTAGDDCLRKLAHALSVAVNRPADFVARYGGEEFVCVLPETDNLGAIAVGQRLCSMIQLLAIPHHTSSVGDHVSISLGVATLTCPTADNTIQEIITAADRCLYKAKALGRNRLESVFF